MQDARSQQAKNGEAPCLNHLCPYTEHRLQCPPALHAIKRSIIFRPKIHLRFKRQPAVEVPIESAAETRVLVYSRRDWTAQASNIARRAAGACSHPAHRGKPRMRAHRSTMESSSGTGLGDDSSKISLFHALAPSWTAKSSAEIAYQRLRRREGPMPAKVPI